MAYWLVKSEPGTYSWEQLVKDKKTTWDGIRNYAARNNLREMKKGDHVFFYHSNEGMEITGIASVAKEAFQDPTTDDKNWLAVEIKPVKKIRAVNLAEIKKNKILSEMALVKNSRLSVQPVTKEQWEQVLLLSEKK